MKTVGEIFDNLKNKNKDLVFVLKIENLRNTFIANNKKFESIFQILSLYVKNNYKEKNSNKIVLITINKNNNSGKFSINLTFTKTNNIKNKRKLLLNEIQRNNKISSANYLIKKFFNGNIELTFYKNNGRVITCYFNLE